MAERDMELPGTSRAEFVSEVAIQKEWVIDNAFLRRIPQEVAVRIAAARMDYLAERASLGADVLKQEAAMFSKISKLLAEVH